MSTALFGGSARASSKNMVEFKAGKMYMKGQMVHPDKRKGQVYVYQAEDSLMHFCWKDRTSGTVEEDLIIFPDDCEYKKVSQCTTGRVFVLKFKSSNRRLFFWMQEPKTEKDEDNARRINELLNNPPTPGSQRSGGGGSSGSPNLGSEFAGLRDSDIQNLFGNISQQQLMQILGGGMSSLANLLGPSPGTGTHRSSGANSASATAASTPSAGSAPAPAVATPVLDTNDELGDDAMSGGPIQLTDLQSILSGISVPSGALTTSQVAVDLSTAMTAETLQPLLTNQAFVDQLQPYLPATAEPLSSGELLHGTVTSPQFQQAVSLFSSALQSGQLGPLINQFGLGEEAVKAATACDMEAFIKALGTKKEEKPSDKEEKQKLEKKDQDKDDDESMLVD